jgi:hypothetical protein
VLECDFDVKLVNPYFIRQLSGRKTDVKDTQWIATVLQKQLIKDSFVPDPTELDTVSRREDATPFSSLFSLATAIAELKIIFNLIPFVIIFVSPFSR